MYHNSPIDYTATFFCRAGVHPQPRVGANSDLCICCIARLVSGGVLGSFEPPWVLGIFPQLSADFFWHAVLPVFALGTGMSAVIARLTRAGLLEVLSAGYIVRPAPSRVAERSIIIVHALKNSLIPVATPTRPIAGRRRDRQPGHRTDFALNGMGRKFISSIGQREYFLLTSLTIIYAVLLVAGNLFVDILYGWLDPRIRYD